MGKQDSNFLQEQGKIESMNQKGCVLSLSKGFAPLIIIIIATLVIGVGVGGFLLFREKKISSFENEKTAQQKVSSEDITSPIEPTPSRTEPIPPSKPKTQPELKPKSAPPQGIFKNFFENGLNPLCSRDTCQQFCRDNPFACEAYCISRPQNKYCQQHFSFVYDADSSIGHPLMKFPEFRNYNYTFSDGKIDQKDPKIEHIGIEIDFYNKQTNKAGDFVFHTFTYPWGSELYRTKIFHDFGETALKPGGIIQQGSDVTYIVPLGTKVRATTGGIVTTNLSQKGSDHGHIGFSITKPESPLWSFGYDHIMNLTVKEGDRVVAGQILGETSNDDKWLSGDGYGVIEIGVAYTNTASTGHCPFMYLDESVKQDYLNKIKALHALWEEYTGNSSLYDEDNDFIPGCIKKTLE